MRKPKWVIAAKITLSVTLFLVGLFLVIFAGFAIYYRSADPLGFGCMHAFNVSQFPMTSSVQFSSIVCRPLEAIWVNTKLKEFE